MGLTQQELQQIGKILGSTNHGSGASDLWKQLMGTPSFHQWWDAHGQGVINASAKGTTRMDSLVLAYVAFRFRSKYGVGYVARTLEQGLEKTGGWEGALNRFQAGLGTQLLNKGPLKNYQVHYSATTGGGQAPGLPEGISNHDFSVFWGNLNDVYTTWLGRKANRSEALSAYKSGTSFHTIQQHLIMSKEFTHTQRYQQAANYYNLITARFMGDGYQLKTPQIQSFLAHGYSAGDVQAWIYAKPEIYKHSNEYNQNKAALVNQFVQMFGFDPTVSQGPLTPHQVTNRGPVQGSGGQGGGGKQTVLAPGANPYNEMISQAALHFQSPDQFAQWLRRQPFYGMSLEAQRTKLGPVADAGLAMSPLGRPVQQGLNPGQQSADIGR